MLPVKSITRLILTLALLAATTGAALAQSGPAHKSGKLTPRLQVLAQSAELSAKPGSSALARALSLPESGPGSLMRSASGEVMVYILMTTTAPEQVSALTGAGARVIHVSAAYRTVTAYLSPARLAAVAMLPAVLNLREEFVPASGRASAPAASAAAPAAVSFACPQGIAVSEGDLQTHASLARSTHALDGSGVTVGILSDSYNQNLADSKSAAEDIASGDLPGVGNPCGATTPVNIIANASDPSSVSDEGRGMLQIVHDLAPGASLAFASAWNGLPSFADNIRALRTAGADIIADDIFYFNEPFFQEGPVNVAISDVVALGATYFSFAGNHNKIIAGKNVSSYEAPAYRPTTCPAAVSALSYYIDCHDFDPGAASDNQSTITLTAGGTIDLDFQWAEPWYGVSTDLDIFLLDSSGAIVAQADYNNLPPIGTQQPYERFTYISPNPSTADYHIVIARYAGNTPRLKYIFLQYTSGLTALEYNASSGGDIVGPTIYGHSATSDGISIGAVPYSNATTPETFTSRGPATFYFGPVTSSTPASAISPQTVNKPDLAATDGGCTTFFGGGSAPCFRFYGTSAAAPHAAAVAALVRQKSIQLGQTPGNSAMKTLLTSTAQAIPNGSPAANGAGLIDAQAAAFRLVTLYGDHLYLPGVRR